MSLAKRLSTNHICIANEKGATKLGIKTTMHSYIIRICYKIKSTMLSKNTME